MDPGMVDPRTVGRSTGCMGRLRTVGGCRMGLLMLGRMRRRSTRFVGVVGIRGSGLG